MTRVSFHELAERELNDAALYYEQESAALGSGAISIQMQNELEQHYVFLRLASADLEQALQSLAMIRRYRRQDILSVLIRDAVVAYGRPFFNNYGPIAKKKNLRLPDAYVPQALWSVHQRSISLRKQAFAHTYLEPLNPRHPTKPIFFRTCR
jgi:hypothetical protein